MPLPYSTPRCDVIKIWRMLKIFGMATAGVQHTCAFRIFIRQGRSPPPSSSSRSPSLSSSLPSLDIPIQLHRSLPQCPLRSPFVPSICRAPISNTNLQSLYLLRIFLEKTNRGSGYEQCTPVPTVGDRLALRPRGVCGGGGARAEFCEAARARTRSRRSITLGFAREAVHQ